MSIKQLKPELISSYLSHGFPLKVNNSLILDYTFNPELKILTVRNNGTSKTVSVDVTYCGQMVWNNEVGDCFDINYNKESFICMLQHRLNDLIKNPSVLYFTNDPQHKIHTGFWFGKGSMFSLKLFMPEFDPGVDVELMDTDLTDPSSEARKSTMSLVNQMIVYVKNLYLKDNGD